MLLNWDSLSNGLAWVHFLFITQPYPDYMELRKTSLMEKNSEMLWPKVPVVIVRMYIVADQFVLKTSACGATGGGGDCLEKDH